MTSASSFTIVTRRSMRVSDGRRGGLAATVVAVRQLGWSGALVAIALVLMGIAEVVPMDGPWRILATVVFVLIAPGASLVPLMGLRDTGVELAMVIPVSIATVILSAVVLFYTNTWTPGTEFATLLAICMVALAGRVITNIVRQLETEKTKVSPDSEREHNETWYWLDEEGSPGHEREQDETWYWFDDEGSPGDERRIR